MRYKNTVQYIVLVVILLCGGFQTPSMHAAAMSVAQTYEESVMPSYEPDMTVTTALPVTRAQVVIQGSECMAVNASTKNLTQDQQVLNLNQPVSCFSLALGVTQVQQYLSVTVARPMVSLSVPHVADVFTSPQFAPRSPTMVSFVLPERSFDVLILLILLLATGFSTVYAQRAIFLIKRTYSLAELCVLRC